MLSRQARGLWNAAGRALRREALRPRAESEEFWALRDVSFEVRRGEAVGIIGRNGAGKSTLLKILSRITEPSAGRVTLRGRVASLLEVGTGFHPELTGRENIYLNGAVLGMTRAEIKRKFDEIVAFAEVEKFLHTPVKRYSSGMYVRLAFAVAAHLEPEILVVDEVLAVGDAQFQKKSLGKMGDVAKGGRIVLFVSHNLAAVAALCQKAILLKDGRLLGAASAHQVIADYQSGLYMPDTDARHKLFFDDAHAVGITNCVAELTPNAENEVDLTLRLDVISHRPRSNIGVGFQIDTLSGVRACMIAPMMTNYVIDRAKGSVTCAFRCESVSRFLAGGDYSVTFWLSQPRVEALLWAENALRFSIPPSDPYMNGVYFECEPHGIVPLPTTFQVEERHPDRGGLPTPAISSAIV
ncbi:MAG TPA: ABC transporter ATP-binding protein [Pirellulales bacterium]|nr:ABC transporter ATP-binding protein [Pirellulales bacterium]